MSRRPTPSAELAEGGLARTFATGLGGDPRAAALDELASGTTYADAVHRLLGVVRAQLGMQVAWVSEFVGDDQVLRFVDAEPGAVAPEEGSRHPLSGSYCARVLDGRFPPLIPDARAVPDTALIDTGRMHIGSYVGVPLLGPQGAAVGMLCAMHETARPSLDERDVAALGLLATLLRDLQARALSTAQAAAERQRLYDAVISVIDGRGRHAVLQPIVDLTTGFAVAAEGLTRFTAMSPVSPHEGVARTPAQWFDDASRLGLRDDLELSTAEAVLDLLDTVVPSYVAVTVNLGPEAILSPRLPALLDGRPLHRVVLEMTEHAQVADYDTLAAVLEPYRAAGLALAVDDTGAGYSSLQHVLAVRPDLIKVDMALVRGCDSDVARRTLLTALVDFAEVTGSRLVAEGIETDSELRAVAACGVDLGQGYLLARPSAAPQWDGYPKA